MVADGWAGFVVAEGVVLFDVGVPPGRVPSGLGVVEGVDPSSSTVWGGVSELVSSIPSMVQVYVGALTLCSSTFSKGVEVMVKVALGRKGVFVAVPGRSILNVFNPGLQAVPDQVMRMMMPRSKRKRFRIMGFFSLYTVWVAFFRS